MNKISLGWLAGLFFVLLIPVYAHAAGEIKVSVDNYHLGEPQNTMVLISVKLQSEYEIKNVTAKVDDRVVELAPYYCNEVCTWTANFPLDGLKQGQKTVTVTALDYAGQTGTGTANFLYDAPPEVMITGVSRNQLVQNGKFQALVSTKDELSTPDITVTLRTTAAVIETLHAKGFLDHEFNLTAYKDQIVTYRVEVFDGNHILRYSSEYQLYVDPTTKIPQDNVEGMILDFDGTRILYRGTDNKLRIKNRTDGTETIIYDDNAYENISSVGHVLLTPTGAIMNIGIDFGKLFVWSSGNLIDTGIETFPGRGAPTYYLTLQNNGKYVHHYPSGDLIHTETGEVIKYQDDILPELSIKRPEYQSHKGWIASTRETSSGRKQIFLESPEGTVTQVTYFNGNSSILDLNEHGSLAIGYNNDLYMYHPGDELPKKLTSPAGKTSYHNGSWYQAIEGGLFLLNTGQAAPADTTAPHWPGSDALIVTDVTYHSAVLQWQPAVDDTGVASYQIFVNGERLDSVSGSVYSYAVTGLAPDSRYSFRITALDAAGNISSNGNPEAAVLTEPYVPVPASASLSLQVKPGFLDVGSAMDLKVQANDAADLYAFLLKLQYDSSSFKLTHAWLDKAFGTENKDAVLGKQLAAAGTAKLSGVLLGQVQGHTGNVGLVTLRFTVLKQGSGEFVLDGSTQLADSRGAVLQPDGPVRLTVKVGGADFDGDGRIGLSDLMLISRHQGSQEGQPDYNSIYDLNHDGRVDIADVQYVANKAAARA